VRPPPVRQRSVWSAGETDAEPLYADEPALHVASSTTNDEMKMHERAHEQERDDELSQNGGMP
jgi:hypothetical protein